MDRATYCQPIINREVASNPYIDVTAMSMMLYSLPDPLQAPDAIGVLTGLGERWRLIEAIDMFNNTLEVSHLVITGSCCRGEKGWFDMNLDSLSKAPYNLHRTEGVSIQTEASNAREQAEWIVGVIRDQDIKSMSLFVSPYHLLRGYCTVLAALRRQNYLQFPLLPFPVTVSPSTLVPETGNSAWDSVAGEVERILKYQEWGDVATLLELRAYLDWLWTHPLIAESV